MAENPLMNEKMKQAAEKLNIKGRIAKGKEIYSAGKKYFECCD
jgi:hypothetical protein